MRRKTRNLYFLPVLVLYLLGSAAWVYWQLQHAWFVGITAAACLYFMVLFALDAKEKRQKELDHRRSEARIKHMAYYDDMTGLPNRRMFREKLEERLQMLRNQNETVVVIYLDIDRFKLINDSLGHDSGDMLLLQIAERLTHCVGVKDFLSRMEGDEYAIFYSGVYRQEDIEELVSAITDRLEPAFQVQDYSIHISASLGISMRMEDDDTPELLMKYADLALSRAKEQGRNNYQLYTHSMNMRSMERLQMENDMRRALADEQFILHYQPQVNVTTGEVIGMEALLRWKHPERGMIPPGRFIPVAEENGMIVPIGKWVLYQACKQNKEWQDLGYAKVPVSVNLSTRQFVQQNLPEQVAEVLRETGLEPRYLELELTESMTLDVEYTVKTLVQLKQLGIQISIDDFGTGYSSLSYLKKFPIHKLKIDRSFVRDIMDDPNDAAIVATIIAMARHLKLQVIAEGVETVEQLHYLRENHCHEVQGYYFSEPIPKDKAESFFSNWNEVAAGLHL
ncbi:putative bifunctional diguanylate cyclase/phosphodiesterase [Xylanibacillus composti]|uniref:Diguanylate cyclase (GGDEF)-like protein n=1 Tax=Xylanibacillus composti TaxID=1572762 RepID=A0A8J4H2T2_9BACL|nr:EAL domain-containing protein [Xylanibacillus composti]GIQ69898.1 hypothetical protein XYCOK13_27220 [Xylanibacillus composti]